MANTFSNVPSSVAGTFGVLKVYFQGPIIDQLNNEIPLYKIMEEGREKYNGLQVNRPLRLRRNQGVGTTSAGGLLPTIGAQTNDQAIISAKYSYLRFGVTGAMIAASKGDKGSFVDIVEYEMKSGMDDLKNSINRQLFWNGSGQIATVSANAIGSATLTITGRTAQEAALKYLDIGTPIDILSSAGVVKYSGLSVASFSGSQAALTATITLSQAVTVVSTDIIVLGNSYNNDMQGLEYTLDAVTQTSAIYGITRSTYPVFTSNVVDAANAQLSLQPLKQVYNACVQRGGKRPDTMICDYDTERFYERLLVPDRRYPVTAAKVPGDGTFSDKAMNYLEYAGCALVPDKDAPQRFYMLRRENWKKYVLNELSFAEESGAALIAQSDTDAYEARLRYFANVFCEKPSNQGLLKGYVSP